MACFTFGSLTVRFALVHLLFLYYSCIMTEILELDENLLSGSVPFEMASLKELQYLKVKSNSLTGEISKQLCQNALSVLEVDCNEVSCSCCEFC
jgi:hypothetical protein